MPFKITSKLFKAFFAALISVSLCATTFAEQRPLQVSDIMKFRAIDSPHLSDDGKWLAYSAQPDRGDSSYHIQSVDGEISYQVNFGTTGVFSKDGRFIAVTMVADLLTMEQADKKQKEKLKNSLEVIELTSGKRATYLNVESFALSDKHGFLAFLQADVKQTESDTKEIETDQIASEQEKKSLSTPETTETPELVSAEASANKVKLYNKKRIEQSLTLINLENFEQQLINDVDSFTFSPEKPIFVYSVSTANGETNALNAINLKNQKNTTIINNDLAAFNNFSWNNAGTRLAFGQGKFSEKIDVRQHQIKIWQAKKNKIEVIKANDTAWFVSDFNKLTWSKDDDRLFFGFKVNKETVKLIDSKPESQADLYNTDKLTAARNLKIWHGEDPLIKTNEKYQFGKDKKLLYTAVYHLDDNNLVRLANKQLINVTATDNKNAVLASTDLPYRKLRTWQGFLSDFYIVDLESGKKSLIAKKLSTSSPIKLSESGQYAVYYENQDFWLYDRESQDKTNLTKELAVSFADENHDYPSKTPSYGIAGWLEDDQGILVYDKFDIWLLKIDGKTSKCLTCEVGRPNSLQFRINDLDKEQSYIGAEQTLLLTSYNDELKNYGFYQLDLKQQALTKLVEENKKFKFIAKAKDADKLLFTREDFNEFPDLWVSDLNPATGTKLTDVNPQKQQFLWGEPELIEWQSSMNEPHQGILIKPANYVPGVKYPVVVYYYRKFSQRMYEFNAMRVNHRPNFPFYTSNGYAVFLPDVNFEVGTPGHSTNKSILPGIQKIIDMGIADKDAIGLHGHSWSGYQTLFSITQTNMFAAAVSGAPVANMTSAYSGIRLGTGLARQFQYEQGQSRIGASMFERRDLYIENSPVFFADRINTPLLMQFGDIDDAVPWQQGIEMYLAMRRLEKEVILLQYEGEPHHLKKYPNKVDYTIKMKQYFDHYLKGAPAAKWMVEGEAYREKAKKD